MSFLDSLPYGIAYRIFIKNENGGYRLISSSDEYLYGTTIIKRII